VLTSILQTAKQQNTKPFDILLELLGSSDQHKILDLVPARETSMEPVNSSLPPPPRFAVPDILAPPPSPGLAAAPV
jgi:hypothetical protein